MRNEIVRADTVARPIDALVEHPVVERIDIEPREARHAAAPSQFAHGKLGGWLNRSLGGTDRLYLHQALALASVEQDLNVVVSTATASGKSLVFMAAAIRKVLSGKSRVLVFYVQKALGSDQLGRWRRELKHAGLSPDLVAEINGDVPVADRERILEQSRIILATPDVIHAWMMPARTAPSVARFLSQLDSGEFVLSRSIVLLVVLLLIFAGTLVFTLTRLTRREAQTRKQHELQRTESALEAALAALVMSYVAEREEKRKQTAENQTPQGPL